MLRWTAIAWVLCLAACSTPYGEMGLLGGLEERPIDKGIYEVKFRGNGYTSRSLAESMVMLKAAELTLANGYQRFVLLPGSNEGEPPLNGAKLRELAKTGNRAGPEGLTGIKSQVSYAYAGGIVVPVHYSEGAVIVVMFGKGDAAAKSIDAATTVAQLRPVVMPEEKQAATASPAAAAGTSTQGRR